MSYRKPTYETFALYQICPVLSWFGVWWDAKAQTHFTQPVVCLALVTRTSRRVPSGEVVPEYGGDVPQEERREIVGIEHSLSDGFGICDEDDNFCGLLAPQDTLADFEATNVCGHTPQHEEWERAL